MTTQSFVVSGMTCGHCAAAVTAELSALDGVRNIHIKLVPGTDSTVSVTTDRLLSDQEIAAALDEAGDYGLSA